MVHTKEGSSVAVGPLLSLKVKMDGADAMTDLMINFLYGQSKYLIKVKFDQTFTPNARIPVYIKILLIILFYPTINSVASMLCNITDPMSAR